MAQGNKYGRTRRYSQPLAAPLTAFIHDLYSVDHNPLLGRPFGVAELDVRHKKSWPQ